MNQPRLLQLTAGTVNSLSQKPCVEAALWSRGRACLDNQPVTVLTRFA
ncbi:MAG: hypothetical protein AB1813_09125 [Verrucomicrobiota bacterium]